MTNNTSQQLSSGSQQQAAQAKASTALSTHKAAGVDAAETLPRGSCPTRSEISSTCWNPSLSVTDPALPTGQVRKIHPSSKEPQPPFTTTNPQTTTKSTVQLAPSPAQHICACPSCATQGVDLAAASGDHTRSDILSPETQTSMPAAKRPSMTGGYSPAIYTTAADAAAAPPSSSQADWIDTDVEKMQLKQHAADILYCYSDPSDPEVDLRGCQVNACYPTDDTDAGLVIQKKDEHGPLTVPLLFPGPNGSFRFVTRIDLSHNNLCALPFVHFDDMPPSLVTLDLSHNKIREAVMGWRKLPTGNVDLKGQPTADRLHIKSLNLSGNELQRFIVDGPTPETLHTVDLSHNKMTFVAFDAVPLLPVADAPHMSFPASAVEVLDLSNNNICFLNLSVVPRSLRRLFLDNNPNFIRFTFMPTEAQNKAAGSAAQFVANPTLVNALFTPFHQMEEISLNGNKQLSTLRVRDEGFKITSNLAKQLNAVVTQLQMYPHASLTATANTQRIVISSADATQIQQAAGLFHASFGQLDRFSYWFPQLIPAAQRLFDFLRGVEGGTKKLGSTVGSVKLMLHSSKVTQEQRDGLYHLVRKAA